MSPTQHWNNTTPCLFFWTTILTHFYYWLCAKRGKMISMIKTTAVSWGTPAAAECYCTWHSNNSIGMSTTDIFQSCSYLTIQLHPKGYEKTWMLKLVLYKTLYKFMAKSCSALSCLSLFIILTKCQPLVFSFTIKLMSFNTCSCTCCDTKSVLYKRLLVYGWMVTSAALFDCPLTLNSAGV